MKLLRYIMIGGALCIGVWGMTACSSDDDPQPFTPALPADGGSAVTKITYRGNAEEGYDWVFEYSNKRLVKGYATKNGATATANPYTYTSSLNYRPSTVEVYNNNGDNMTLTLNAKNYIQQMQVNLNTYTFDYDGDGRLVSWRKRIVENSFGQEQSYSERADITYSNGDVTRIVFTGPDNKPVTLTITSTDTDNRNGILTPTITKEMGCLGFEHLYYAGLLGRPTRHLVHSVTHSYSDGTAGYTTTFSYGIKSGNVETCTYGVETGNSATVNYEY